MKNKITNLMNKVNRPKINKHTRFLWNHPEDASEIDNLSGPQLYRQNVIVYRCINLIASAVSHVPWIVLSKKDQNFIKDPEHQANELLARPAPNRGGADFFSELVINLLIYGNGHVLSIGEAYSAPSELYILPPSEIEPINLDGKLSHYHHKSPTGSKYYPIDKASGLSQVLHLKNNHISNNENGISNLEAARMSVMLHMQATKWNNSLLKNGARPSGAFVFSNHQEYLTQEQFERLEYQVNKHMSGHNNSGKPIILEAGLEWQEMSISPKDMDFIESKNAAARDIALSFGVPPQLLGINGDNTYSNMQEARLALWEETLLPLLDKLSDNFSLWFSYLYGENVVIDFDRDSISALRQRRENLWAQVSNTNFMTINEKRAFFGLEPIKGGEKL